MTHLLLAGLLALAPGQPAAAEPPSIIDRPAVVLPEDPEAPPGLPADPDAPPAETALEDLPLRQRVAQLMAVTMAGSHQPSAEDLAYLKSYTPGAAIIRRIMKPSYAAVYVEKLRGVEQVSGVPLWIGTNIYRLTTADRQELNGFIQLPSPLTLAAADDPQVTEAVAELLAQHLSGMGFNLHLGPALDLAPTLDAAAGSVYNFGSDPDFITETFQITRRVFDSHGILAVPFGFPGGGGNREKDSPAVLLTPATHLHHGDLAPYRQAISDGAPIIHVGNTLVPTLDPTGAPASVSPAVLRDLLRGTLQYTGIVLAGPMDSRDVARSHDPADAAIRALSYGADMILWDGAHTQEMRAVDKITAAVLAGRLDEERINEAIRRVLQYKFDRKAAEPAGGVAAEASALEKKRQLAERVMAVEQQAITLVKNDGNILPLREAKSMPVGITGTVGVELLHKPLEKHFEPISQQHISTARHLGEIQDFEIERVTKHIRGIRTVICILGETDRPRGQVRLIRALKGKGVDVVVILLGYPRNLPYLTDADAILLAYCDSSKYGETIAAMADVIVGEGPVGFIPVTREIAVQTGEARTFNAYDFIRVPAGRLPVTLDERFTAGTALPYDPRFTVKRVRWDFGDGANAKEAKAVHTFKSPGNYPVSLAVTTESGDTSHFTFHVVANAVQ